MGDSRGFLNGGCRVVEGAAGDRPLESNAGSLSVNGDERLEFEPDPGAEVCFEKLLRGDKERRF